MVRASTTTYGLLGMLAVRSWTGYELTRQLRRSLRFVWSSSEGHLYREQKRLVDLGWATVEREPAGGRSRNRYHITDAGRQALLDWLATAPEEPHFEIEGMLRLFHGSHSSPEDLARSLRATGDAAASMLVEMGGFAAEYLESGGPMEMLEADVGGPGQRRDFHGRQMYPERLGVVAMVLDGTTRLLADLRDFCAAAAEEVAGWDCTSDVPHQATRRRLEDVRRRARP